MHIFGLMAPFFLLDTRSTFDAIIGFDLLKQAGADIDLRSSEIRYGNVTEQLKFFDCQREIESECEKSGTKCSKGINHHRYWKKTKTL